MDNQARTPLQWEEVKTFIDEESGLAVLVTRSISPHPRYSMKTGIIKDGKFSIHLPFFTKSENGQIIFSPYKASIIPSLIAKAEVYMQQAAQAQEDEYLARKISKDLSDLEREKRYSNKTGKTARKKNRQKSHSGNQ